MKMSKRGLVLGVMLLGSVAATIHVYLNEKNEVVQVTSRKPVDQKSESWNLFTKQDSASVDPEANLSQMSTRRIDEELLPLFDSARKKEKIEQVSIEPQPVAPTAPPLPFKFFGKMHENDEITLFLSMNERNLIVKTGDTIDGVYRVDLVNDRSVEFTYLPMQLKQTLPIGGQS